MDRPTAGTAGLTPSQVLNCERYLPGNHLNLRGTARLAVHTPCCPANPGKCRSWKYVGDTTVVLKMWIPYERTWP